MREQVLLEPSESVEVVDIELLAHHELRVVLQLGEVELDGCLPAVGPVDEPDVVAVIADHVGEIKIPVRQADLALDPIFIRRDEPQQLLDLFRVHSRMVRRHVVQIGEDETRVFEEPTEFLLRMESEGPIRDHPGRALRICVKPLREDGQRLFEPA